MRIRHLWAGVLLLASGAAAADKPRTTAEVRVVNGLPELFVNGRIASRVTARVALPGRYAVDKLEQYKNSGIDVFITAIDEPNSLGWDGASGYDYTLMEHHLRKLVAAKPDIRLIVFVGCTGEIPHKWSRANEDQLARLSTGVPLNMASTASYAWRRDSSEAMRRFVEHFENSAFADNIIGYNPVWSANEWFGLAWQARDPAKGFDDYSEPMKVRFRDWLKMKYGGDVAKLRTAWNEPNVTFESAELPTPAERLAGEGTFSCCDGRSRKVADYYRCYAESNAELAIAWCDAIKKGLPRPKLAGLMGGEVHAGSGTFSQHRGHGALKMLLDAPSIDFLHSPPNYLNTRDFMYSMHPVDAVTARGKLFLTQTDAKTFLYPREEVRQGEFQPGVPTSTPWETMQIMKRDMAYPLSKRSLMYWLEGGPGEMFPIVPHGLQGAKRYSRLWYDDPELQGMFPVLKAVTDRAQASQDGPVAQIALVTSGESRYYQRPNSATDALFHDGLRNLILSRVGAPYDDYILEDFDAISRRYKVYIFPNAFYVSSAQRRRIRERLEREGATAIWFYAPGYVDESGCGVDRIAELTGINVVATPDRDFLQVTLAAKGHAYLRGLETGISFGSASGPRGFDAPVWRGWPERRISDFRFSPVIHAADKEAITIGTLKSAEPGVVLKKMGRSTSVYFGAPMPPWQLLQNILEHAGVHLYERSGDLVYASKDYVTLYTRSSGRKVLSIPAAAKVRDAITGEVVAQNASRFEFDAREGETRIFRID